MGKWKSAPKGSGEAPALLTPRSGRNSLKEHSPCLIINILTNGQGHVNIFPGPGVRKYQQYTYSRVIYPHETIPGSRQWNVWPADRANGSQPGHYTVVKCKPQGSSGLVSAFHIYSQLSPCFWIIDPLLSKFNIASSLLLGFLLLHLFFSSPLPCFKPCCSVRPTTMRYKFRKAVHLYSSSLPWLQFPWDAVFLLSRFISHLTAHRVRTLACYLM